MLANYLKCELGHSFQINLFRMYNFFFQFDNLKIEIMLFLEMMHECKNNKRFFGTSPKVAYTFITMKKQSDMKEMLLCC